MLIRKLMRQISTSIGTQRGIHVQQESRLGKAMKPYYPWNLHLQMAREEDCFEDKKRTVGWGHTLECPRVPYIVLYPKFAAIWLEHSNESERAPLK